MTCPIPGCAGRCHGREPRPEVVEAIVGQMRAAVAGSGDKLWGVVRRVGGVTLDDATQDAVVLALHTERVGGASAWDPRRGSVGVWVRLMARASLNNRRRSVLRQSKLGNDALRESYTEEG